MRVYTSETDWKEIPAIWREDKIVCIAEMLDVTDIDHMASMFSDTY